MDLEMIERLMQMLSKSDVEELEVTEGNLRIRLAKGPAARGSAGAVGTGNAFHASPPPPEDSNPAKSAAAVNDDEHTIVAGLPGTFYRAAAPGAVPFVSEGDAIRDGQQLAIVEAMKMMNPVEADCDGTVAAVLLGDAVPVQAGTPLFRIRKAAT